MQNSNESRSNSDFNKPSEPNRTIRTPDKLVDRDYWKTATRYQFIYSILGLVLGLICIIAGIFLFLNGIAGNTNWTLKILGAESVLNDATAGVVIFIIGFFVVFITRFNVSSRKGNK